MSDSGTARLSGGAAMMIKKVHAKFVELISLEYDNCLALKVSKKLTGLDGDCLVIGMYIPPSQSTYYNNTEIENGMYMLEHCLLDAHEDFGELPFIIIG